MRHLTYFDGSCDIPGGLGPAAGGVIDVVHMRSGAFVVSMTQAFHYKQEIE